LLNAGVGLAILRPRIATAAVACPARPPAWPARSAAAESSSPSPRAYRPR
jgi:hypothetical protein